MTTFKGDALDYMSNEQLKEEYYKAEVQEIAQSVLSGKVIPKTVRQDKNKMRAVMTELARYELDRQGQYQ